MKNPSESARPPIREAPPSPVGKANDNGLLLHLRYKGLGDERQQHRLAGDPRGVARSAGRATAVVARTWQWTLIAMVVQVGWGLYPVVVRFLQKPPGHPIPPFRLVFYYYALASLGLLFFYSLPLRVLSIVRWKRGRWLSVPDSMDGLKTPMLGGKSHESSKPQAIRVTRGGAEEGKVPADGCKANASPVLLCLATSSALVVQVVATVFAARAIEAYWVQLALTLAPVVVGLINTVWMKQPLPKMFWGFLVIMFTGSLMMIYGTAQGDTPRDFNSVLLGSFLSTVGMLSLAVYLLLVQFSKGVLTQEELMWSNCINAVLVSVLISAVMEPGNWFMFLELDPYEAFQLGVLGLVLGFGFNLLQQMAIRAIGAPMLSSLLSLRLMSSVLGSGWVLSESLKGYTEMAGVFIVIMSLTFYLQLQLRVAKQQEAKLAKSHLQLVETS